MEACFLDRLEPLGKLLVPVSPKAGRTVRRPKVTNKKRDGARPSLSQPTLWIGEIIPSSKRDRWRRSFSHRTLRQRRLDVQGAFRRAFFPTWCTGRRSESLSVSCPGLPSLRGPFRGA